MIDDDFTNDGLEDVDESDSGPAAESHSVRAASARAPTSRLPFAMLNIFPLDTEANQRHAETPRFCAFSCRTIGPRTVRTQPPTGDKAPTVNDGSHRVPQAASSRLQASWLETLAIPRAGTAPFRPVRAWPKTRCLPPR